MAHAPIETKITEDWSGREGYRGWNPFSWRTGSPRGHARLVGVARAGSADAGEVH